MIQLSEWIGIALALTLLLLSTVYLIYFRISRKLFPQVADFSNEIKSGEGATISKIEGSGIIKMIELKTDGNCIITITVDNIIHTLLTVGPAPPSKIKIALNEYEFAIREQLNEKFTDNFTIYIQNQGTKLLSNNGKLSYEIKKGLKQTLKALISEIK